MNEDVASLAQVYATCLIATTAARGKEPGFREGYVDVPEAQILFEICIREAKKANDALRREQWVKVGS